MLLEPKALQETRGRSRLKNEMTHLPNTDAVPPQAYQSPKVFISYCHEGPERDAYVLELADRLRMDGIDAFCDQYSPAPAEGWPRWMEEQISAADFVLIICTKIYHERLSGHEKPGTGKGVLWEASLIYQLIYDASSVNSKFIPLLLPTADADCIPGPLKSVTHYKLTPPFSLSDRGYEDLYRRLTDQARVRVPVIGLRQALGPINPNVTAQSEAVDVNAGELSPPRFDEVLTSTGGGENQEQQITNDNVTAQVATTLAGTPFANLTEVSAILGVVVNIIGIYTFIGGGTTATKVLFLAGIVWLLFLVVAVKSPVHRRTAVSVLAAVPLCVGGGFAIDSLPRNCPKGHVCVVVAVFDKDAADTRRFTQLINEGLMDVKQAFPELDILKTTEFIPASADKPLFPQAAHKFGASLVFWGDFETPAPDRGAGMLTFAYHVLKPSSFDFAQGRLLSGQVSESDWLTFVAQNDAKKKAACLTQLVLGLSAFEAGQYDNAIVRLNAALNSAASAGLALVLPTIYINRGRASANLGRFDQAIQDYTKSLQLAPSGIGNYQELGRVYFSMGRFDEAIEYLDKFIAFKPKDKSGFYDRGLAYLRKATTGAMDRATDPRQRMLGLAEGNFSATLEIDKVDAAAFNNRGLARLALHKQALAIEDFGRAIELRKNFVEAYENRGRVYAEARDWKRAIDDYSSAIRFSPGESVAYAGRGTTYASQGDFDHAIRDFSQVLSREPGNIPTLFNRGTAYSRLAIQWPAADRRRGDAFDNAIRDFSQVIIRQYADPNVYYNVANLFMEIGETGAAIVNFGEAIRLKPDFGAAYYNRGLAYKRLSQFDSARSDFIAAAARATEKVDKEKADAELSALTVLSATTK